MALLDPIFRGLGKDLLALLGGTATLQKTVEDYDPDTDTSTTTTTEVVVKHSPPEAYTGYDIDGTVIQAGDAKTMVSAKELDEKGFSLAPGSHTRTYMVIGTQRWTIVRVNEIRSGDEVAVYELQLRH